MFEGKLGAEGLEIIRSRSDLTRKYLILEIYERTGVLVCKGTARRYQKHFGLI